MTSYTYSTVTRVMLSDDIKISIRVLSEQDLREREREGGREGKLATEVNWTNSHGQ